MTLQNQVVKNIINRLINGRDYRIEVISLINAEFLQFAIEFFGKVVNAKLAEKDISVDWYRKTFLADTLRPDDIAIHAGLNKKTIANSYNSATREIVIKAANEHYDVLRGVINGLIDNHEDVDLTLSIRLGKVSVDLNMNESLIVINALAVKRAALRGGLWSAAGKNVEKYLMAALCRLFDVPAKYFKQENLPDSMREVDFYLIDGDAKYRCEVKLMGVGNPEGADSIFAREPDVFVGDKLSDLNKEQAEQLKVEWVQLRAERGYMKFAEVLGKLKIPHKKAIRNLDRKLDKILDEILPS